VIQLYMAPLMASTVFPQDQIKQIFSVIELIYKNHVDMLNEIDQRVAKWSDNQLLGDIFAKRADYLKIYTEYVTNYENNILVQTQLNAKYKQFPAFLKEVKSKPECKSLSLGDYLIMPIQRIPRYRLLLEDLLKNTPPKHKDLQYLPAAVDKIKELLEFINVEKMALDALIKLDEIQKEISYDKKDKKDALNLVEKHRILLQEGDGNYKSTEKKPSSTSVHFFLFSDLILFVVSGGLMKKKKWKFLEYFTIDKFQVQGRPGEENGIDILSPKQMILYTKTPEERNSIITHLGTLKNKKITENVLKEGYLNKKGEVMHGLKQRYFVLTKSYLKYFEGSIESTRDERGSILRANITEVRRVKGNPKEFEIVAKCDASLSLSSFLSSTRKDQSRIYELQAETEDAANSWIAALK